MSAPGQTVRERPYAARSRRGGVAARAELTEAIAAAAARLAGERAVLLLALGLDDFRRYNAEHGYAAGDALLEDVAGRLAAGDGDAFALGADAFALVLEGTPEELWRRAAAALWTLDPSAGGSERRCSFGAAVLAERGDDAGEALAQAEDRLAAQRNRAPSVAERYGELILTIMRAQQPDTTDHALDVAQLAAGSPRVSASIRSTAGSSAARPSCTTSARSPSTRPSSPSPARSKTTSGRRCAGTRSSATTSCSRRRRCARSPRSSARRTSAGTAAATPTASPARTSRSPRASSPSATPTTR